jgi:tetratricopeptide (TPR) repeat protein
MADVNRDSERRTLGPAWHRRVRGLHVLRLQGSHFEMGRQHGALLGEAIRRGPLPYYRTYVEKVFRASGLGALSPLAWWALRATVGRHVGRRLPDFARETVRGLAEGSGLPLAELLDACTMPDSLLWVVSRNIELRRPGRALQHRVALELGCSSALAWGAATQDGALLHGRNLDYQGVGHWPREAAVIFHAPAEGQRYVSATAAGIPLGGFTAMNEAGLSLAVHQHMFSDGTALGGTPIGVVGDIVMREASNLDEAQRILERHTPIGCWTYVIGDAKRRQVLCWEENPRHRAALRTSPTDTTFRYSNIYLDPTLGATEQNLYGSYWRHNEGRYRRLGERLAQEHGHIDADRVASILGDTGDGRCRIRQAVAMLMTVASVVFRPEDGALWVASGESPTSHRAFVPFHLGREDHAPELGELTGGIPEDPEAVAAFDAYREAYLAYFDRRDIEGSRRHLDRAIARKPKESIFHAVAGLLALGAGDANDAVRRFDRALELGHPDVERRASFHLWRARALDLCGRRADAVSGYGAALAAERSDPPVAASAREGVVRPYTRARARRIAVEFAFADVVRP